jgi:hypothetical protein
VLAYYVPSPALQKQQPENEVSSRITVVARQESTEDRGVYKVGDAPDGITL